MILKFFLRTFCLKIVKFLVNMSIFMLIFNIYNLNLKKNKNLLKNIKIKDENLS